jgi:hypothetical protein
MSFPFKIIKSPQGFTRRDAEALCAVIKYYWAKRHRTVDTYIEEVAIKGSEGSIARIAYYPRSNMINGLPESMR